MTDNFDFREVTDDESVDIIDTPVATEATGASDITAKETNEASGSNDSGSGSSDSTSGA